MAPIRRREPNIQRCLDVRWVGSRRKTSAALAMSNAQKKAVVHSGSKRNSRVSENGFVRTVPPGGEDLRRSACIVYRGSETLRLIWAAPVSGPKWATLMHQFLP